jgi:hypothetical protein
MHLLTNDKGIEMARILINTTREEVYNAQQKLIGYLTHRDYVERPAPPAPGRPQAPHAAAPPAMARQALRAPVPKAEGPAVRTNGRPVGHELRPQYDRWRRFIGCEWVETEVFDLTPPNPIKEAAKRQQARVRGQQP